MSLEGVARTAAVAKACKGGGGGGGGKGKSVPPLLHYLYKARSNVVHSAVGRLLRHLGGAVQLLVLGAGLDTSFETIDYRAAGVASVFAVDLPSIIEQRLSMPSAECTINIALDLNVGGGEALMSALESASFRRASPTIVVFEMVLGYLTEDAVRRSLLPLLAALPHCVVVSYDATLDPSNSPFGGAMAAEFARHGAPLRCLCPTRAAQARMFTRAGFAGAVCYSMSRALGLFCDNAGAAEALDDANTAAPEYFDEHASLWLLQHTYALTIAASAAPLAILPFPFPRLAAPPPTASSARDSGALDIRPAANASELAAAAVVYEASFRPWALRYTTVRRFVKSARKALAGPTAANRWGLGDAASAASAALLVAAPALGNNGGSEQQRVLGCVGVTLGEGGLVELSHFGVSEDCRRLGIGSRLLRAALELAAARWGAEASVHLSVLRDQDAALRLYQGAGFLQVAGGETDCGEGAVLLHMAIPLAPRAAAALQI